MSEDMRPTEIIRNKIYIDVKEDALIDRLKNLFENISNDAPSYCTHGHTTYVESLWN